MQYSLLASSNVKKDQQGTIIGSVYVIGLGTWSLVGFINSILLKESGFSFLGVLLLGYTIILSVYYKFVKKFI